MAPIGVQIHNEDNIHRHLEGSTIFSRCAISRIAQATFLSHHAHSPWPPKPFDHLLSRDDLNELLPPPATHPVANVQNPFGLPTLTAGPRATAVALGVLLYLTFPDRFRHALDEPFPQRRNYVHLKNVGALGTFSIHELCWKAKTLKWVIGATITQKSPTELKSLSPELEILGHQQNRIGQLVVASGSDAQTLVASTRGWGVELALEALIDSCDISIHAACNEHVPAFPARFQHRPIQPPPGTACSMVSPQGLVRGSRCLLLQPPRRIGAGHAQPAGVTLEARPTRACPVGGNATGWNVRCTSTATGSWWRTGNAKQLGRTLSRKRYYAGLGYSRSINDTGHSRRCSGTTLYPYAWLREANMINIGNILSARRNTYEPYPCVGKTWTFAVGRLPQFPPLRWIGKGLPSLLDPSYQPRQGLIGSPFLLALDHLLTLSSNFVGASESTGELGNAVVESSISPLVLSMGWWRIIPYIEATVQLLPIWLSCDGAGTTMHQSAQAPNAYEKKRSSSALITRAHLVVLDDLPILHTMVLIGPQTHNEDILPMPIVEGSSIFGWCTTIVLNNCHITNCAGVHSSVSHHVHPPWPPTLPIHMPPQGDSDGLLPPPATHSGATEQTRFRFIATVGRGVVTVVLAVVVLVPWRRINMQSAERLVPLPAIGTSDPSRLEIGDDVQARSKVPPTMARISLCSSRKTSSKRYICGNNSQYADVQAGQTSRLSYRLLLDVASS
ncbi:hypothetical protein BKA70DRAFT_1397417 [Coprinopsis sp. MPI-PUGE-AT-0042]|nr:hypothetical protein BKA70DRAFT_1397417 [Coprinopsis sp. MPI-PUGE-AT-0042]